MQGEEKKISQALALGDLEGANLDERERALFEFVQLVTHHAYKTTPETIEQLKKVGWTEEQIAETIYVTSLFAMFNRVADAFGLDDPQYALPEDDSNPTVPASHFE